MSAICYHGFSSLPRSMISHFHHNVFEGLGSRDGTLEGYTFSKRYKKVSPHRKSHNLLYNLLKEKNKPPQEMVNKRGVPFGPTWLTRTLGSNQRGLDFGRKILN